MLEVRFEGLIISIADWCPVTELTINQNQNSKSKSNSKSKLKFEECVGSEVWWSNNIYRWLMPCHRTHDKSAKPSIFAPPSAPHHMLVDDEKWLWRIGRRWWTFLTCSTNKHIHVPWRAIAISTEATSQMIMLLAKMAKGF